MIVGRGRPGDRQRSARAPSLIAALRDDQSGAAAVEFAFISSILFTFILGIFWLGWGIYCGADVRHAIERGSRIYLSNRTATDQQFEDAVATNLFAARSVDITYTITKPTISGAQMAQIAWVYDYSLQIPFVPTVVLHMGSQIAAPISAG